MSRRVYLLISKNNDVNIEKNGEDADSLLLFIALIQVLQFLDSCTAISAFTTYHLVLFAADQAAADQTVVDVDLKHYDERSADHFELVQAPVRGHVGLINASAGVELAVQEHLVQS